MQRGLTSILFCKGRNILWPACRQPYRTMKHYGVRQDAPGCIHLVRAFKDVTRTIHAAPVILSIRSMVHAVEIE
jgi:hypothetical protein